MLPSVSVIIPTYNRKSMVCEAIESVWGQTLKDFELLVVDDGSTDGTIGSLRRYSGALRILRQTNRGVAAARNLGVRSSRGEWLAFLDSDDLWMPGKLERQMAFVRKHPKVQICQTEEVWIRRGVRVNPKRKHRKPSGDIFRSSLQMCLVSPSSVLLKRRLFNQVGGFDESLSVCEDYDLWLRIACDTSVHLIPEPLMIKRGGHEDQLSRSTWGLDRFRVFALQKLLRSGLQGEKRYWVLQALAQKVAILAGGARKRGRWAEAQNYEAILGEFYEESRHAGYRNQ